MEANFCITVKFHLLSVKWYMYMMIYYCAHVSNYSYTSGFHLSGTLMAKLTVHHLEQQIYTTMHIWHYC